MNFEIYAYWNTTELVNVFNAVAAITGSGNFTGLLRTLALVMIIGMVLAVLAGKGRQDDFWRWVVLLALMHGLLLVPKSNVLIVDRTGTNPTQVVANVPIGLAALAHSTSKIGDWLTTAFETVFSLPEDVQLRKTGTLFGHRVMLERLGTQFRSPILVRNLDEFYRECVIPDLARGYISPDALAETENIWQEFSDTNPGLLVTITDYTNPSSKNLLNCPSAYTALTAQINRDANTVLGLKAQGLYPEMSTAFAKAALSNAMTNTQQFFAPSSSATPVLDQIKQGALCNYP
jgi:conjugal transfer mating pair stabilization protein TraG